MTKGNVVEYQQIVPASMRADYVRLTDRLIHQFENVPDPARLHVLFLDKSARPVAWLVRALWPIVAREPGTRFTDGLIPKLPPMSFANIDREQWWHVTGASETGQIDIGRVPEEQIIQLRFAFAKKMPADVAPAAGWKIKTWLDGKHIIVVDEVRASGDTLTIAGGLVSRAFPESVVDTAHWMAPEVRRGKGDGVRRQIVNPVWYSSHTDKGRLVGNRMDPNNRVSHWRGRLAPLFMSTVFPERDQRGLDLRNEIAQIARDVASGVLLAAPSPLRDLDDVVDRIQALYGYSDPRAFTEARERQDAS